MSSGYTRQSAAEIIPSAVVKSSSFNAELNKLRDAFDFSTDGTTGHTHDGSSDEGSYVPLIADVDGNNKAVVSTTNNRIEFYVSVSDSPVEQVRLQDGVIVPVTTNDVDLGSSGVKFKDLHLAGNAAVGGTVTSTGGFVGDVTGDVTGGVTGNVTGDLTGNVTASSGSSTFENVTINGTIDVTNTPIVNVADPSSAQHAATKAYVDAADNLKLNLSGGTMSGAIAMGTSKITGLGDPTLAQDAATKNYVDTQVSGLVDAAPGALDTLNELAAALGDDPNFATTVTDSIATKLPLAGGTMSGAIAMGTNKVTGLGTPTNSADATTKTYVDTADALKVSKAGDTMSGALAMGSNKITGLGTPTTGTDATTKAYVDGILGSATAASDSADAAALSASNAAASYDQFDDRYLGSKASDPSVDNDGDALLTGALYWNSVDNQLKVYDGAAWNDAAFDLSGVDPDILTFSLPANTTISTFGASLVDDADAATARTTMGLGTAATTASADYATAAQGSLADTAVQPAAIGVTVQGYSAVLAGTTASYTTAEETKLAGIEALADVTDTANVTAAGALMDSEVSANLKTLVLPASTTISTFGASLVDDVDAATARTTLGGVETTTELNTRDTANRSRANHTGTQAQSTVVDLVSDLAAKAPLASPTFTGTPTAPTPTPGDNSTKLATTAYVDAAGGGGLIPVSKTVISGTPSAVDISLTGYDAYFLRLQGITFSATATLRVTLSDDGGSVFTSIGYNGGSMAQNGATVTDAVTASSSYDVAPSASSSFPISGDVRLYALKYGASRGALFSNLIGDKGFYFYGRSTSSELGDPINMLRLSLSTGNFSAGEIHVYGYAEGDA